MKKKLKIDGGVFITLEGPDGSGKTTAAGFVVQALKDKGFDVVHTREPGGTIIAEEIRNMILNKRTDEQLVPMAELLLFATARAQHIEAIIKPALSDGKIVVCDRFSDTTYAYQGAGRGLTQQVLELEQMVHQGFEPKYTLFFDVALEESIKRMHLRAGDNNRLDDETIKFKKDLNRGYLERFEQKSYRMVKINAMCPIEEVNCQITQWINQTFFSHYVHATTT